MNTKRRITLLSVTILLLATITGCSMYNFHSGIGIGNQLKKEDAKELKIAKYKIEPIKEIDINTQFSDIEIIASDDYYVKIDYLYWEEEPEYTVENGVLIFNDRDSFPKSYSINFNLKNIVKVYLPEDADLNRIEIATSSGNIHAEGFITSNLDLVTSYGDLSVNNAAAEKADFRLSSGSSKIKDFSAGKLNYTNSYGGVEFTNINTGDLKIPEDIIGESVRISMSSGNCSIQSLEANMVDISNSYGDVTCKDIIATEAEINLSSGGLKLLKASITEADIRNSYGDVTLSLIGDEEDYELDLNTSYGSIEVEEDKFEGHLRRKNNGHKKILANLSSGDINITFLNK